MMHRAMQPFNFRIVPKGEGASDVPGSVAMDVMQDIQRMLTDIGELMIRRELRLQGRIPEPIISRFSLSKEAEDGEAVTEGDDTLMLDALNQLFDELDQANMPEIHGKPSNHVEAYARRDISRDLLALCDHLDGYNLMYGSEGSLRKLRFNRREKLEAEASMDCSAFPGAVIGIISADPTRSGRWVVSSENGPVPVTFDRNIDRSDIPLFSRSGPVIAAGTVVTDGTGAMTELRSVIGCYSFPSVKFHRIITAKRDIILLVPADAVPKYDSRKGMWSLENEQLGISVSKPSWDECVLSFHEYFAFLWEMYKESDGELEGEELEIRDLLRSMELIH